MICKSKLIFFLSLIFIFNSKLIYCDYYINETNAAISEKVKEYNYYAEKLYKKIGIKLYFNLYILPKNVSDKEKYMEEKTLKLKNTLDKESSKYIAVLYELKTNNFTVIKEVETSKLSKSDLENLLYEYVNPYFEYIFYRLNRKSKIIDYKYSDIKDIFADKRYLEDDTLGMLGMGFLFGISTYFQENLEYNENYPFKISSEMRKLTATYEEKEQKKILQKKKKRKQEHSIVKKEKSKEREEKKDILKNKEANYIDDKWRYKLNFFMDYTYRESKSKEKDETIVNPVTNLVEEVYEESKESELSLGASPILEIPDKIELKTSFKFSKINDYINKEKNYSKIKFEYLSGKYTGETYNANFVLGDIDLRTNSYLILNDKYRGMYGDIQYYLNYNPEKLTYKRKLKQGKIKNKANKSIRISGLKTDEGKSFGEDIDQAAVNGFLLEGFLKNKTENNLFHFGYIYGNSEKENINNAAQNILLEHQFKNDDSLQIEGQINYLRSSYKELDINQTGERYETVMRLDKRFPYDYFKIYFRGNYSTESLNTSNLSETYENNVPKYINEISLLGGKGFETTFNNSLFKNKLENTFLARWSKKDNEEEYYPYFHEYKFQNIFNINKKNKTLFEQKYRKNYRVIENAYKFRYDNYFEFRVNKLKTPLYLDAGKLSLNYKKDKETLKEDNKKNIEEEYSINLDFDLKNKKILLKNNQDFIYRNYNLDNEKYFIYKTGNNFAIDNLSSYYKFNYLAYKNSDKLSYNALSHILQNDIPINLKNDIFFEEKLRANVNGRNYSYKSKLENKTKNNLFGYDLFILLPIYKDRWNVINYFDFKLNKDKLMNIKEFENKFSSKSTYKKNKFMTIFINYNYKKNDRKNEDIEVLENIGIENDENNTSIISEINSNINYISDRISRDEDINNIESGVKYKIYSKKNKKNTEVFNNKAILGLGFEEKAIKSYEKKLTYKNKYFLFGNEFDLESQERIFIKNKINFRKYFNNNNIFGQFTEDFGFKYKSKKKYFYTRVHYLHEKYGSNIKEFSKNEKLDTSLGGNMTFHIKKPIIFQYGIENSYNLLLDERLTELQTILKSDLRSRQAKHNKIMKNKQDTVISSANIFNNINYINRKNDEEKFWDFKILTGGEIGLFNDKNKVALSGGINKRKDYLHKIESEYSNLLLENRQRIGAELLAKVAVDYYVLYSSTSKESSNKKINISMGLELSRFYIESLQLSSNIGIKIDENKGLRKKEKKYGQIKLSYIF